MAISTIAVVTGTRAEYGLLRPLIRILSQKHGGNVKLIVTGTHLSPDFGLTVREIERDENHIDERIEILLSSDSEVGTIKSMGLALIGFADYFAREKPDLMIILGDRYEAFCAAAAATVAKVPLAHIHGGELTFGAFDDAFRHSITKMSYLHFAACEVYRRRIIAMGEDPQRVYNVGAIGVENVLAEKRMSLEEIQDTLGIRVESPFALVTFHPATNDPGNPEEQISELLAALDLQKELNVVFTAANADPGGKKINEKIAAYVAANRSRASLHLSLGSKIYISLGSHASLVLGNSSSGIFEFPSFGVPTVNVGFRQTGRVKAASIIDCEPNRHSISAAIEKALSVEFRELAAQSKNPYEKANTSENIAAVISASLRNGKFIKHFYEVKAVDL